MVKQSIIYLILSILVVVFAPYIHLAIVNIVMFYTLINAKLAPIFSGSSLSITICRVITLVILPIIVAAIPDLIYRAIKGKHMNYFIEITWFIWLILVISKILIH